MRRNNTTLVYFPSSFSKGYMCLPFWDLQRSHSLTILRINWTVNVYYVKKLRRWNVIKYPSFAAVAQPVQLVSTSPNTSNADPALAKCSTQLCRTSEQSHQHNWSYSKRRYLIVATLLLHPFTAVYRKQQLQIDHFTQLSREWKVLPRKSWGTKKWK